jgi:hypothetical protein
VALQVAAVILVLVAGALVARSFTSEGLGLAYASIAASALAALALVGAQRVQRAR